MSLIQRVPGVTITTPGLKLYRDALFNSGSMFGFDVLDAYSANGLDVLADAAVLTDGRVLKNLIRGGTDAVLRVNAGPSASTLNKAGVGVRRTGLNAAIDLGRGYGLETSQHAFLVLAWFDPDTSSYATSYGVMSYAGTSFPNAQYSLVFKPSTNTLNAAVGGVGPGTVIDQTLQQVGMAWYLVAGVPVLDVFRNGAKINTTSGGSLPSVLPTPEAGGSEGLGTHGFSTSLKIANLFGNDGETFFRAYKEDLTISAAETGRTLAAQALAQVQADWAANHARFGV